MNDKKFLQKGLSSYFLLVKPSDVLLFFPVVLRQGFRELVITKVLGIGYEVQKFMFFGVEHSLYMY